MDRRIPGVKVVPGSRGEVAERKQSTVRRLSRVIPPPHSRAVSGLLDELKNGLQKVHVVLRERIHRVQGWQRVLFEAGVADQTAHHRPVFLFHVATVVLTVRPGTGEGDGLFFTVVDQRTVDELATIVGVQAEERKWQSAPDLSQLLEDRLLALIAPPTAEH